MSASCHVGSVDKLPQQRFFVFGDILNVEGPFPDGVQFEETEVKLTDFPESFLVVINAIDQFPEGDDFFPEFGLGRQI